MGEIVDAMDRISELPPFIIHHVMSYLSAKEVARTSILSKRWNQLRTSFPIFDFDQTYFFRQRETDQITSLRKGKKFMKYVDDTLLRFCKLKLSMQKFKLSTRLLDVEESSPDIDKWIGLAIENEVKELDLCVLTGSYTIYSLPQSIFSAKSLTTLKLGRCKLEQTSDAIKFNYLIKLTLNGICINEQTLQNLTSECPLLEELYISYCLGLKHFCVPKALKLKIMSIYSDEIESFQIVVPNLQELALGFSEVKTPRVIDIAGGCPQLKKLKFVATNLTDQGFHQFISKFPLLEDLFFLGCDFLERITISSNQLKKLRVDSCTNLKAIDLDTPNLLSFSYENGPIPTCHINAICPWKVELLSKVKFDTQWCLNVREFLGLSNQIEVLTISAKSDVNSFKSEEFRESCPSLPLNVGNLKLFVQMPPSEYRILLDGILWICCPSTLSLQTFTHDEQHKLFKWFYEELKHKAVDCCNSHHIKCWRHYLKDIKIESFLRIEDRKLFDADNMMKLVNTDNLNDLWPMLPTGILRFQLDWHFPPLNVKT